MLVQVDTSGRRIKESGRIVLVAAALARWLELAKRYVLFFRQCFSLDDESIT